VEEQARAVLGKTVKAYEHIENALHDLSHQRLDLVLEENLIADYHIRALRLPLKVAAPFAAPMTVGLGVRKGDREMQEKLSQTLQSMLKDGSLSRISEKWFGYDVSRSRVSHTASH
jgi:ABC-type amino acid transport substrate-binding protein